MAVRQLGGAPSASEHAATKGYVDAALWAPRLLRANFPATTNVGTTAVRIYDKTWTVPPALPPGATHYIVDVDATCHTIASAASGVRGALIAAISNPGETVTHARGEDVQLSTSTAAVGRRMGRKALIPAAEGFRVVISLINRGTGTIRIAGDLLVDNVQVVFMPGTALV